MAPRKIFFSIICVSLIKGLAIDPAAFAAETPATQDMSSQMRALELQKKEQALRKKIEEPKEKPEIEENIPEEALPQESEKVRITTISVAGVTLFPESDIRAIVSPYENQDFSVRMMQKAADLITALYRKKGYVTSRAYLPPQKIEGGVLEIRVLEGRMGNVEVKGNRYFKAYLYKNQIRLKKNEIFDFNILKKSLIKINRHPDQNAKTVLMPGKEPGTTDVLLEAKDKFPIHAGWTWDNYGSKYIYRYRHQFNVVDNNLLGLGDILNYQYALSEGQAYYLWSARYLLPAADKLDIGFAATHAKLHLGKDFKNLDIHGESTFYSIFANRVIMDDKNITSSFNVGFDYKDVSNFQFNDETSKDNMRVVKVGLDVDSSDKSGRMLVTNEFDFGIPEFMGGLKAKDSRASRDGSGGEFMKYGLSVLKLVRLPFSAVLLSQNQFQFSNKPLTSTEQFQLGGIANVRGYPPAELVGDYGLSSTVELSCPAYFIPKNIKIPRSKETFHDAIRFVCFYDYGNVHLRKPQGDEKKYDQLSSVGYGMRVNIAQNFSLRLDFAWALDKKPSDGDIEHSWIQLSTYF